MRVRTRIQVVYKNRAVEIALRYSLLNRLFHFLAGGDVLHEVAEPFVRGGLDAAAGNDDFGMG